MIRTDHGGSQEGGVGVYCFRTGSQNGNSGLVKYSPGGHTEVHLHPNMEQAEIVLEGRALWEAGEFEREVGPGDVIFCPRYAKHGYKVLGDKPFKFLQVEWREYSWRR
ncbi:MAG: cupin domain-containing protein [Acidobacteria bacterium]|nr:cupin domain-containing protein [Acidobacteriota bacterium]